MHIHILGICGTFMGSLALLAREMSYQVTGSDENVYPPMSDMLRDNGVTINQGHHHEDISPRPDHIVVGNVMKRGMPIIEHLLNERWPLVSGPEFLAQTILKDKKVLAVTGTHGKTTTASILAWILQQNGLEPGFLIGGVPNNFDCSARLGSGDYFVIEADEYDSAFFDKRPKFIHYRPQVLLVNNIEFDHADIYRDLFSIQQQFHFLIRTLASNEKIVFNQDDPNIADVLNMGCWSKKISFGNRLSDWNLQQLASLEWSLAGEHNLMNALGAVAVANEIGVAPEHAIQALQSFQGVKRRLEVKAEIGEARLVEDFAHHPTAIEKTINTIKQQFPKQRLIVIIDFCSNTMAAGHHSQLLPIAVAQADEVYFLKRKPMEWDIEQCYRACAKPGAVVTSGDELLKHFSKSYKGNEQILGLSNGAFSEISCQLSHFMEQATVAIG